jgi:hypothetical protein
MSETVTLQCPVRAVGSAKWLSLEFMGIKRLDVVAYTNKLTNEQFSFAGGHRVRITRFWDNIHFLLPQGTALDIKAVAPAEGPTAATAKRRHHKVSK